MDAQLVETTIKTYLTEIRNRVDKAAGIGGQPMPAQAQAFMRRASKSLSTWSNSCTRPQRYSMPRA